MGQRTKHFFSNTKHSSRLLLLSLPLLPVLHHHPWYNWELFRSLPADCDATVRFLLLISWAKSDGSQLDWYKSHDCERPGWFSHDHRLRNRSRGERTEVQRGNSCTQPSLASSPPRRLQPAAPQVRLHGLREAACFYGTGPYHHSFISWRENNTQKKKKPPNYQITKINPNLM
jgi:hypothetical protein